MFHKLCITEGDIMLSRLLEQIPSGGLTLPYAENATEATKISSSDDLILIRMNHELLCQ
jgi:hypothetical protein